MLKEIKKLNEEEQQLVMDALPLVTLLIAGADGKIDDSEINWADKLADIRSYSNEPDLNDYYEKISKNFSQRLSYLMDTIPAETREGNQAIADQLSRFNDIFPKLSEDMAAKFYKSMVSFARHIARADGGFLKLWSISKEEADLIDLPMIVPVEMPAAEEEDEEDKEE